MCYRSSMGRPRMDPVVRFWRNVDKSGECWEWTTAKTKGGYGHFWVDGKFIGAHRQSFIWEHGYVPVGMDIDHLCRNPSCVRPSHLEAVTHAENIRRGMALADTSTWGDRNRAKTHCPYGHEYSEENTYTDPKGGRRCRICRRKSQINNLQPTTRKENRE